MTRTAQGVLAVALVSAVLSVLRTVAGGQDVNFDLITYHFYLGYSAFHDRLARDFLAASFQGYQSPLPYALLYLLERAGLPPLANAAIHACLHAANLVLLFLLTKLMLAGTRLEGRTLARLLAWLLGAVAPLYWELVGTSFADLETSALVLAALWLVARSVPDGGGPFAKTSLAVGAALAGAAVAMRVHTAVFAAALAAALVVVPSAAPRGRLRALGLFTLAAGAAWLVCFGPWAMRLYREFGNPLFPFYNAVFRSPDFPPVNLPLTGFVPASVPDALLLPFRMATYRLWLYGETPLPDARPALAFCAVLALVVMWIARRVARMPAETMVAVPARRFVMAFFLLAMIAWLVTSANGRYGVPLFLLLGPVCAALLAALLHDRRAIYLAVAAVLAWQLLLHQILFNVWRYNSLPWSAHYFDWNLPAELTREPALYLSFGTKTGSTLVPRLAPGSRHVNLVGQYSIETDHPGARRVRRLIEEAPARIYGIFDVYYTRQPDPAARSIKADLADQLRRWDLDFAPKLCHVVDLRKPAGIWTRVNQLASTGYRVGPLGFIVCELQRAAPAERERALAEYGAFRRKLAPFEAECPRFLGPAISVFRIPGHWWVSGLASFEYRLEFPDEGVFSLQLLRPPYTQSPVGVIAVQGIVSREPDCDTWFARVPR